MQTPPEEYLPNSLPAIFSKIQDVAKTLSLMESATLRQANLTPAQFFILRNLWEEDGRPLKELADSLNCTPATMTGIADTLERKKLVYRAANPADRRSLLLKLTEAGKEFQQSVPKLNNSFGCCCDGLTTKEIQLLHQLLDKLSKSLECVEEGK
jgi:DNA-binding MarR family transcriptional regulator